MFGNQTNARWIAIAGLLFAMSACAACLLLVLVLNLTYGGQTVAFRNPLAPPTATPRPTATQVIGGGSAGEQTNGGGDVAAPGTGGSPSSNQTSGVTESGTSGGAVPSGASAANYLPSFPGYSTANAASIQGAINLIAGTGGFSGQSADGAEFSAQSLELGAIATSVLVSRVDDFIACYRDVGAVEARVYVQTDVSTLLSGGVPPLGAIAVINQDQLRENLIACAVSPNDPDGFRAQSANQPCGDFGSFRRSGDTFTYLYAGTSNEFCSLAENYYNQFGG
jgi:hypothetical protein